LHDARADIVEKLRGDAGPDCGLPGVENHADHAASGFQGE
jgi:hypothetical protein